MSSKRRLVRGSMVVGFFSFLGSVTGILVETSVASRLGLSRGSDTFYVAFTVPYIITNLLAATGQFSLVPFFSSFDLRRSPGELWRGFSYAVNLVLLGLGTFAAVAAAAMPWVTRGIAPGFTPGQIQLATQLGRWLFVIIVPAGVAEVLRSFLLSQGRFVLASSAGFIRNATAVGVILLTFDRYGAYGIVLGFFAGYFLQLVVLGAQVVATFDVHYSLTLAGSGAAFKNLHGAGSAQIGTALAWQGVAVAERIIGSFLPAGTITALNYGLKITSTLSELLAGSVGTAALPALSRAVVEKQETKQRKTFQDAVEITLILVSPVTVFCLLFAKNIIRLVFQHGHFTPEATSLMSTVFFYYSLALLPYCLIRILSFFLFARQQAKDFVRLSLIQYGMTLVFDLVYVAGLKMGPRGIPLGLLTGLVIATGWAFRRNLAGLENAFDRSLGAFTIKNLLAAVLAALAVGWFRLHLQTPQTGIDNFLYLCRLCGAGSLVFIVSLVVSRALPVSLLAEVRRGAQDV